MGIFSKKNRQSTWPPAPLPPEPLPVISDSDLADAENLMKQWEEAVGNNDLMWYCLELIGRRGGYKGDVWMLGEIHKGRSVKEIEQRPWCWWNEAARRANIEEKNALTGRIFMFTWYFDVHIAARNRLITQLENGLSKPADLHLKDIATLAVDSLSKLDPGFLISNTVKEKVDVSRVLSVAQHVLGIRGATTSDSPSMEIDGNQ